jgi:trigger factor
MKVTVEDRSSVKKVLHIEVPLEDVVRELDSAYAQLKKTAKLKGFRPGKTPRTVLERVYGKEVKADVSGKLIQSAFMDALKETQFKIVGSPLVDPPELDIRQPYLFDAQVEINPEIADVDFKGFELVKTKYALSDEEVDVQLKMLQKNLAKREKIKADRPLQLDDVAVIDYEGFKDGQPFEPTKKTDNFILKVGNGQIVKDLDDGIIGMQIGEERQVAVTFPNDYFKEELVGQKVDFKVMLNEIREEILPDLDDAFAQSISDKYESLEVLKTKIRENLQSGYEKRIEQELNEQIYQKLLDQAEFEVPETLVNGELEHILNDAERSFAQSNRSFDEVGLSREKLAETYRPTAEKQVRRHLIISKIIEQEKMTLTDDELDQGFQEMADNFQQPVEHIKGYYGQNKEGLEFFKHTLLEKKALKIIIENGRISEVEPSEKSEPAPAAEESRDESN